MGCPSFQESLIILAVMVLVLGATRLPQLGDALGRSIRNFKRGLKGENEIDVTATSKRLPDSKVEGSAASEVEGASEGESSEKKRS